MEKMSSDTALLPEQVWDAADIPDAHMYLGRPTGSAMPLMWSHAEYIKLLRSMHDNRVFDLIPEVVERYQNNRTDSQIEVWQFNRQVAQIKPNYLLRIQCDRPFKLRWSVNEWQDITETDSLSTNLGIEYIDFTLNRDLGLIYFTFYWKDNKEWENKDYKIRRC
jgi:glucoamylase